MRSFFKFGRARSATAPSLDGVGIAIGAKRAASRLFEGIGIAAGARCSQEASPPRGARRLTLATAVALCAVACMLGLGEGSAWAAGGSLLFGQFGNEAGQISYVGGGAYGMAIDRETGDIYVGDAANQRVDEFAGSGQFLSGWGWGVIPPSEGGEGADEFQVCTSATGCREGLGGSGVGEFTGEDASGVAVDNDPLSSSHGDVYVVDLGNHRVQKFDSEGKFLMMFGGHVNKTTNGDVCVAGEACGAGSEGTGDGEFNLAVRASQIAVGPGGDVYVGDQARVEVFEPSGVWKENISLAGLSTEGKVTSIAVNAAGDVFVKDEGVPGVREFEADGVELPVRFDEGSQSVGGVALDVAGDLFVSDKSGGVHFLEFAPSGEELDNFGGGTLQSFSANANEQNQAMVFDEASEELLVYGSNNYAQANDHEYGHYGVWGFPVPPAGPLVESGSEKASPGSQGNATFEALVNPEGKETSYRFEYVDEEDFRASGYADASVTTLASAGSSFEDQSVSAGVTGLIPGVTYHWRVFASNSAGTLTSPDQTFEETPSALVEGPWATNVTSSSATLEAKVDPLGVNTSYRLEYGTSTSYAHMLSGNAGEGMGYVQVAYHVQGLEADTVYHYRVVTSSTVGTVVGADHMFTTQPAGGALTLPDGRAWELVSPADKGGALIEEIETSQAASDGNGIVYSASEPLGEGIVSHMGSNTNALAGATELSTRVPGGGWRTRDISPKQTLLPEGQTAIGLFEGSEAFYTFTPDLSSGILEPRGSLGHTPQSSQETEPTLYLRNNTSEAYEPLVTAGNVPSGTKWAPDLFWNKWEKMAFLGATPDLSHILISDWAALTPEATVAKNYEQASENQNLYEWSGGQLQLVNILPDGKSEPGAAFGKNTEGEGDASNPWAMSSDGRWIVFRELYGSTPNAFYVRDMVEHKTMAFGNPHGGSRFETMSRDGSMIFYLELRNGSSQEGELYVFDTATGSSTDLTADHLAGEGSAGVQNTLVGIGEDGSYVYFVAKGVLASGASDGQDNLYAMHDENGSWRTTFIAGLSKEDEKDWSPQEDFFHELERITSRVSPDGRYVTFMSDRSLTGYDNTDVVSGQPDEEVFLYDAETNRLVCASCDPSGARPMGVHDLDLVGKLLMDESGAWSGANGTTEETEHGHWLAADIAPEWNVNWYNAFHQPSDLSDSGRLFFNTSDTLVPQDTNGVADVYEYEPSGVGDCTSASGTFSGRADGCVGLISSGQSASESTFLDASETGDDVFFITAAKLVSEDYDNVNDVYDAHVCTTEVPCLTTAVSPPVCDSGDSCKAAPSPQPEIFGPAPSATFNGAGNITEEAKSAIKSKAKTKKKTKKKPRKKKVGKPKKKAGKHKKAGKSATGSTRGGGR